MSSERELCSYMAQILDSTDRHEDMLKYVKRFVELSPELTLNECQLLSVAYKKLVGQCRAGLRSLSLIIEQEKQTGSTKHDEHLQAFRNELMSDLEKYCFDLIDLIDRLLIPSSKTVETKVFYLKLKADYYRYLCEAKDGDPNDDSVKKAKETYLSAIDITEKEIPPTDPSSLGLFLNYSVFLYEILKEKENAINLAQKILDDVGPKIDDNSPQSFREASQTLHLLRDNISLWKENEKNEVS